MSTLATAIADEISAREEQRAELAGHIESVDAQLEQLRTMAELAQSLNGNSAQAPEPAKPSSGRAQSGGRPTLAGRNGGDAPGGRRPTSAGRKPGSAPSGSASSGRAPSSPDPSGEANRTQVLAIITAAGAAGIGLRTIVENVGLSQTVTSRHLRKLMDDDLVKREGQSRAAKYYAVGDVATVDEAPPPARIPSPRSTRRTSRAVS